MDLSEAETSRWILAVYGLPGLLGLVLAIRYRQPRLLTGNVFVLILIASFAPPAWLEQDALVPKVSFLAWTSSLT